MGDLAALFTTFLLLLSGSCGRYLPVSTRPIIETTQQVKSPGLVGTLQLVATEEEMEIANLPSRPTILMFAADTCSTCRAEAQELVALFAEKQHLPSNINLYTVLLGGFIEDARDWIMDLSISWPVAIDVHQDQMFKQYCPEQQTPCVLIYHPSTNQLNKYIGKSSYLDWQKETGEWIY